MIYSNDDSGNVQLLRLIKQGNKLAFNILFDRYWEQLYTYTRKIVLDDQAAEDVVQEVFLDLWEKCQRRTIDNLPAYLFGAVRYLALKQLRQKKYYTGVHIEVFNQVVTDSTADGPMELNELKASFDNVIKELPHRCEEIFRLSRYKGLSNQEIADRLNLSKRTVELQISNALKHLKLTRNKLAVILLFAVTVSYFAFF